MAKKNKNQRANGVKTSFGSETCDRKASRTKMKNKTRIAKKSENSKKKFFKFLSQNTKIKFF
jgi:hypothetical protein